MLHRTAPLLLAACASAGTGEPVGVDASTPVDSRVFLDAPIDAPIVNTCASAATCQAAMPLGTVSGDTGNMKLAATTGHQSAWFRVRVTEDDSDVPGLTLRVAAKLTSPQAVDFDVFVYVNAGGDTVECSTTNGTTTTNGNINEVRSEWGEGAIPNGSDDSRDVSIEVRPIGTECSPAQQWSLDIEGNWN